MNYFKQISFYKWINMLLLFSAVATTLIINFYLRNGYCIDVCSFEQLNGFIKPIYFFTLILSIILLFMLMIPVYIFRKWLFFIAPPILLITFFLVIDISVYSSNVMQITRASMAQFGMYVLAAVTIVFVLGHLLYDYKK